MLQLEAQNEDLVSTVETLKSELIASSEDAAHASQELDAMRSRALQDTAQEMLLKDRELRETQGELERCRMERDEWEHVAMREKMVVDEARTAEESMRRDLEVEQEMRQRETGQLEMEREQSRNLQSVLEDFQAGELYIYLGHCMVSLTLRSERPRATAGSTRLQKPARPSYPIISRI